MAQSGAPADFPTGQPGVLAPVPAAARFVTWALAPGSDPRAALRRLVAVPATEHTLIGLGAPLLAHAGGRLPLAAFPGEMPLFPATQGALWARFDAIDPGQRFDHAANLAALLGPDFVPVEELEAFTYRGGRDLSGFEDGTENPHDEAARAAAVITGAGPGLDGASFVAVQRWIHDLAVLARMTAAARDNVVGRELSGNKELTDAPPSAHVKRTAQESFDPAAFMVRRSMPYGGLREHGLYFVAFVESLGRFSRMLARMGGLEDGIVDALFSFSRAVTGGYYFCPPVRAGRLDLTAFEG
jgi:putative iron-dependent peroxidase